MDQLVLTTVPLVGGIIIMTFLILVSNQSLLPPISPTAWVVGLVFGVALFLVNFLVNKGFSDFDLNLGTIVISSELLFSTLFAYLVFNEVPLINEVFGAIFIMMAVLTVNFKFSLKNNQSNTFNTFKERP